MKEGTMKREAARPLRTVDSLDGLLQQNRLPDR